MKNVAGGSDAPVLPPTSHVPELVKGQARSHRKVKVGPILNHYHSLREDSNFCMKDAGGIWDVAMCTIALNGIKDGAHRDFYV